MRRLANLYLLHSLSASVGEIAQPAQGAEM